MTHPTAPDTGASLLPHLHERARCRIETGSLLRVEDTLEHKAATAIEALLAEVERLRALVSTPVQERKPGEGWQISPETHREIEAIERSQREARANMPNILIGAKEGDTP